MCLVLSLGLLGALNQLSQNLPEYPRQLQHLRSRVNKIPYRLTQTKRRLNIRNIRQPIDQVIALRRKSPSKRVGKRSTTQSATCSEHLRKGVGRYVRSVHINSLVVIAHNDSEELGEDIPPLLMLSSHEPFIRNRLSIISRRLFSDRPSLVMSLLVISASSHKNVLVHSHLDSHTHHPP